MTIKSIMAPTPAEHDALKAMFEARKQVFVDLLKWDLAVLDQRYEVDQFDDSNARYLIVCGTGGAHRASARLLPTDRPHILGSLFSSLCETAVPAGPGIAEITRFCLDRRQSAAERKFNRNRLVSALVRHALANGIRMYTGVAHFAWLQQILAFGWSCRPLGAPHTFACGQLGALSIEIDDNTPSLLAANGIWQVENDADARVLEAA